MSATALAVAAMMCLVDDAHYTLRHAEGVTMSFLDMTVTQDWPLGLAAVIHFNESGRTYYFLPWNGGTNGQQNMAHTTDVTKPDYTLPSPDGGPGRRGDIVYLATDANYDIINHAPNHGEPASAHILLPDLREVTWYGDVDARDGAPKEFFDLDGCAAKK
jgi:hypothetical protein